MGRCPENQGIFEFLKSVGINRKFRDFWEQDQMGWKFQIRLNFLKFRYTSRSRPCSWKFRKILFRSSLEISENSDQNFESNEKRGLTVVSVEQLECKWSI